MAYISHPHHRDAALAGKKSQWTISVPDEHDCYKASTTNNWFCGAHYWGLYLTANKLSQLGTSPQPVQAPLHIAKFVGDTHGVWHGYPVAHWMTPFDKPGESVLKVWLANGLIKKPAFAKIHRGKRCAL